MRREVKMKESGKKSFMPLIQLFLYGQRLEKEQIVKIRRDLIKILVWSGMITLSEIEKVGSYLFSSDEDKIIDRKPEVLLLCTLLLSERFLDSREDLKKLRRAIVEFLLKNDPPLLAPEEVENTFLLVSINPDERYSNNFYFFYDAFIAILSPKLVPQVSKNYLVIGGDKDEFLEDKGKFKIKRRFYSDYADGGYYSLFLKIEESYLSRDEEDSFEDLSDELADNEVAVKKKLINFIFGGSPKSRLKQSNLSFPLSGSQLNIPESVEPPGIAEFREFLEKSVIGQDRAIREVVRALNIAKAGIFPPERPLLVQFWAGPTGVGKTELAISIANFIWQREKELLANASSQARGSTLPFIEKDILSLPLVRVDCGMFSGSLSHGVSNLIGSPAGYVGSKGDRRNAQPPILSPSRFPPNRLTVLLFDEFEKAVQNSRDGGAEIIGILMNILDKGEFQNNWNETVSFRNTIIIFTSNIGSNEIIKEALENRIGFKVNKQRSEKDFELLNARIYEVVKKKYEEIFPPEFRSRIHRLIVFRFLSDDNYLAIINKEFGDIKRQLKKELNIDVELTKEAALWILSEIHAQEGVRKLRDLMYREIVEPLARAYNLGLLWPTTYLVGIRKLVEGESDSAKTKTKVNFLVK